MKGKTMTRTIDFNKGEDMVILENTIDWAVMINGPIVKITDKHTGEVIALDGDEASACLRYIENAVDSHERSVEQFRAEDWRTRVDNILTELAINHET